MLRLVKSWVLVGMLHRLFGRAISIILQALDHLVGAVCWQAWLDEVVALGVVIAVLIIRAGRNQAHVDFLLMRVMLLKLLLLSVPRLLLEGLDDGDTLSFVPLAHYRRDLSCLLLRGGHSQGGPHDRCVDCLDLGLALCGQVHIYVRLLRYMLAGAVDSKILLLRAALRGS